jgi:hypothetical protein
MEKTMETKYDWGAIKALYVLGISNEKGERHMPTLKELAEQYGANLSTLTHHSSYEEWPKLRQEAQEHIYRDVVARFESDLAAKLSQGDRLVVDTSILVLREVHNVLADPTIETKERLQLANKYLRLMESALNLLHKGVGVETELDSLEELRQQIEEDPSLKMWNGKVRAVGISA